MARLSSQKVGRLATEPGGVIFKYFSLRRASGDAGEPIAFVGQLNLHFRKSAIVFDIGHVRDLLLNAKVKISPIIALANG
jgi:hypothetical protein